MLWQTDVAVQLKIRRKWQSTSLEIAELEDRWTWIDGWKISNSVIKRSWIPNKIDQGRRLTSRIRWLMLWLQTKNINTRNGVRNEQNQHTAWKLVHVTIDETEILTSFVPSQTDVSFQVRESRKC